MENISFQITNTTKYFWSSLLAFNNIIKKGKAIPLQAWTGPEGSRRLRFPDFKTIGT
jgi:hypothetical protein